MNISCAPQADLMRTTFKLFIDNILPNNIENMHKIWKKQGKFPTMEDLFDLFLFTAKPVDYNQKSERLSLGTIDDLMETLKKMENHVVINSLNISIDTASLREKFEEQFSSDELKKREAHFLEDCFSSYKDLYSKYEVIEFFLGFLLEKANPGFDPTEFRKREFRVKLDCIKNFRREFENNGQWKMFLEFGFGRPRDMRNLEAHEELAVENNTIKGWPKDPNPPIQVKEFNELFSF